MGNSSTGSERWVGDRDGACDGERWNGGDSERFTSRGNEVEGGKETVRVLTTRRSSCGAWSASRDSEEEGRRRWPEL
jgi:hypothetical protein